MNLANILHVHEQHNFNVRCTTLSVCECGEMMRSKPHNKTKHHLFKWKMFVTLRFLSCCMHTEIRSSWVHNANALTITMLLYTHTFTLSYPYLQSLKNNSFCRKMFILLCNLNMHKKTGRNLSYLYNVYMYRILLHFKLYLLLFYRRQNEVLCLKTAKRHFNDFQLCRHGRLIIPFERFLSLYFSTKSHFAWLGLLFAKNKTALFRRLRDFAFVFSMVY